MKAFLSLHASGIAMLVGGGVLYALGNHTEGLGLIVSGLTSFGIKIGTGTTSTTKKP